MAALPPHPLPFFFSCGGVAEAREGGGGGGRFAAGFGGGAAFGAGAALGAALAGGGGGGGGGAPAPALNDSSTLVPPPFATPSESSVGSKTSWTSPNRTMVPGAIGVSVEIRSPSTNVPLVDSRSTNVHTPSRRCSLACDVDTDSSVITRSL